MEARPPASTQALHQKKQDYQDFVARYDQGAPHENISPDEAQQRHDQVARNLPPDEYGQAAENAFGNLPAGDRTQVGKQLADQVQSQGVSGIGPPGSGSGARAVRRADAH